MARVKGTSGQNTKSGDPDTNVDLDAANVTGFESQRADYITPCYLRSSSPCGRLSLPADTIRVVLNDIGCEMGMCNNESRHIKTTDGVNKGFDSPDFDFGTIMRQIVRSRILGEETSWHSEKV